MKKRKNAGRSRLEGGILLAIYLAGLLYFTFFAESLGRTEPLLGYTCNLVPFREIRRYLTHWSVFGTWIAGINLIGNIAAFVPFGLLLPVFQKGARSFLRTTAGSLLVSLGIETVQLLTLRGSFDVDDLILNTIGGMIGYVLYRQIDSAIVRSRKKSGQSGREG